MKDFFDTWKFKILIAIAVFLVGIMAYAGANGRLTAAPQELLSVAVAPFQRAAAAVSSGVASLWENYANIDAILEENQQLSEENASLRSQMVDYDKLKAENEAYKALANILTIDLNSIGINLVIPTGTLLFFVLMAVLMWAFLHTKTGTAMTAVGSNPAFARAAGINVDKMRLISVIMSTWLGAVGILVYEQGFGFIQLYNGPFWMAMPAVAAILIGGASVNKASIGNVIIGTILYQGVVTMTPTVMSAAFQMDMSEVIRIVVSNGMILYALTRKTERGR